jgi:putative ABC transport system permease protein
MIKHYIRLFIRNLLKNKIYSLFSLASLVIALTTCLIISIYADYEYSFDDFHKNNSKIYRVLMSDTLYGGHSAMTCYPITSLIKTIPEIENSVVLNKTELLIKKDIQFFREEQVFFTEPSFFEIFDFKIIDGDPQFLSEQGNVLISESIALKIFSNKNVIDKDLTIKDAAGQENTLVIKGIFEDFPENSHIKANILMSYKNIEKHYQGNSKFQWNNRIVYCYILSDATSKKIEDKINNIIPPEIKPDYNYKFNLQALNRIHLFSDKIDLNIEKQSVLKQLIILLGIAVLIIILAISNYIIYILVATNYRLKEIIIRRIVGASRLVLFKQTLWESFFQILISFPIVLLITFWILPHVEHYFQFKVDINRFIQVAFLFSAGVFLIGLLSALFVSFYSVFPSLKKLFELFKSLRSGKFGFVKILSLVQLSIFMTLLICLLSIQKQLNFVFDQQVVGFNYKNQLSIKINDKKLRQQWPAFKNELLKFPEIQNVAACNSNQPSFSTTIAGFKWKYDKDGRKYGFMKSGFLSEEDKAEFEEIFEINSISADYFKTLGINKFEGREFSNNNNEHRNIIVNKAFIDKHQIEEPLNKTIDFLDTKYTIVGIVNIFRTKSLFKEQNPVVFFHSNKYLNQIIIQYNSHDTKAVLNKIKSVWKKFLPDTPMEYQFTEDVITDYYKKEKQLLQFIHFFAGFGIVLTLVNLIGFSRLNFNNRKKEIGLRRIVGARFNNLYKLLLKPYVYYSLISSILGIFIAILFMDYWFAQFNETTSLNFSEYLIAILGVTCLTLIVVSINIAFVIRVNMVEVIKNE